jgi:hypothetical protein
MTDCKDRLPKIRKVVEIRLQRVSAQLDSLGEEPSEDKTLQLHNMIAQFRQSMRDLEGYTSDNRLSRLLNEYSNILRASIRADAPYIFPGTLQQQQTYKAHIRQWDEEEHPGALKVGKRREYCFDKLIEWIESCVFPSACVDMV